MKHNHLNKLSRITPGTPGMQLNFSVRKIVAVISVNFRNLSLPPTRHPPSRPSGFQIAHTWCGNGCRNEIFLDGSELAISSFGSSTRPRGEGMYPGCGVDFFSLLEGHSNQKFKWATDNLQNQRESRAE